MLKRILISVPILLILSVFALAVASPKAHAVGPTTVCIAPSTLTTGNVCPSTPPTFVGSAGQALDVNVNMANLPAAGTNTFDISVEVDQTILSAPTTTAAVTISSNFPIPAEICVNGIVVTATCSPTDGSGIVHVVAGAFAAQTANETLFTIHYTVGSAASNTPATIGYATGCTMTSASDGTTCFTLVNASTFNSIPATGTTGIFHTPLVPDFSVSANPTSVHNRRFRDIYPLMQEQCCSQLLGYS